MAEAAPVDVGTILAAQALPRLDSIPFLWATSSVTWSLVYAWTVVINPFSMPKLSSNTFKTGARQLVVQDAAEIISSFPSNILSLTL